MNPKEKAPRKFRRWRLCFLIVILLVVSFAAWFYIEYKFKRPIGNGPAGPAVNVEHFRKPWTNRKVQVVGIGDSITAGLGARSQSHTFFNRAISNPKDEYAGMRGICLSAVIPQLESENFALSGSESSVHLDVIRETLPTYDEEIYGVVLMTSGGNDLIHMYGKSPPRECAMYGATLKQAEPWIANYQQRLNAMFDEIAMKFPGGCEIYIGDIYDPTDGVGDAPSIFLPDWPDGLAIHARYNQCIRRVADGRDNVFVVPLYETFLGHGSHCRQFWREHYRPDDPHYWFFTNIEDPNDRGYDAIRRVFLNSVVANTRLRDEKAAQTIPTQAIPATQVP